MDKNNQKWRDKLTDFEYKVCREKGTEKPFSGKYDKFYEDGEYFCKCCNEKLFDSKAKFDSGSGWPSFYEGIENKIEYIKDKSLFMERTEIICKNCFTDKAGSLSDPRPELSTNKPPLSKIFQLNGRFNLSAIVFVLNLFQPLGT